MKNGNKNALNVPNTLSLIRLILTPVMIALFYVEFPYHFVLTAVVFAVAAVTDFLDGYIARKKGLITDLGKFLDPAADKVLVLSALIVMAEAGMFPYAVGGACVAVVVAREIIVSCLRMVAAGKKVVLAADKLGKIKTVLQDVAIIVIMVAFGVFGKDFNNALYIIGFVAFCLSVLMALVSGVNYCVKNRRVFLGEGEN